jgi:hypothetical protein
MKKQKQKSKSSIDKSLAILTPKMQKTLLKKSSVCGYLIPSEQVKAINKVLSIAYGNVQVAKGLAAISKDDFSFLPNQQRASEILDMMWESEEILGTLKDFLEAQTEPFCF